MSEQNQMFVVAATEHTPECNNATILCDRETVLARDEGMARQQFTIKHAKKLDGKEVQITCRPF